MPNYTINVGVPSLNKAKKNLEEKIKQAYTALSRQFIAEATAFKQKWADGAQKKLKTSNNYINHLHDEITQNDKEIIFTISHNYNLSNGLSLTNLLENGFGPFDMKAALFTGKNVKVSKKGYLYRVIPFNYHNPFKEGEMTTPPHISDDMHEAFSKMEKAGLANSKGFVVMNPKNLKTVGYEEHEIKSLLGQKKLKTGKYNLKDVNLSKQVDYKKGGYPMSKIETLNRSNKKVFAVNYQWKHEQFMRMQKKTGGTGGKVYQNHSTFRTMSTSPYQNQAFIHPGAKPLRIFKDVYESEKEQMPKRLQIYLEELLSNLTGND